MSRKTMLKHAALTCVVVAGVAYAAKESSQIREWTKSESGGLGFFDWLTNLF